MGEAKFTPGEWYAAFSPHWGWCVKFGEKFLTVRMRREDDAVLCAAAPEMYEALKAVIDFPAEDIDAVGDIELFTMTVTGAMLKNARAAIAKAEGRS